MHAYSSRNGEGTWPVGMPAGGWGGWLSWLTGAWTPPRLGVSWRKTSGVHAQRESFTPKMPGQAALDWPQNPSANHLPRLFLLQCYYKISLKDRRQSQLLLFPKRRKLDFCLREFSKRMGVPPLHPFLVKGSQLWNSPCSGDFSIPHLNKLGKRVGRTVAFYSDWVDAAFSYETLLCLSYIPCNSPKRALHSQFFAIHQKKRMGEDYALLAPPSRLWAGTWRNQVYY